METGQLRRFSTGLAVTAALTVSGCVSAADGPSPTEPHPTTTTLPPTTTTTIDLQTSLDNYRTCLAERDVTVGEIPIDARGRPGLAAAFGGVTMTERVVEAMAECAPELVSGALDTANDPELASLVREVIAEYAVCMRNTGVADFPDPVRGFNGVGSPFDTTAIPWDDEDLGPAVTACSAALTRSSP